MNNWGANHGAITYGHVGADLITLASMLRIPVCMHNIDEEKIGQSLMADGHHVSIDAPFQDGEDNCMLDVMPSGEDSRTDRQVDHESMALELNSVLNKVLKDREITIIRECFGIGCHEKGLEEIGDQLGLTRERVRQIREKSIAKLRDSGNAKILMKYLG